MTDSTCADGLPSRLKSLREQAGLARRELSLLAGLSQSMVGQIERAEILDPGGLVLARVADVLGCSLDYLVRGVGGPPTARSMVRAVDAAQRARANGHQAA